MTIPLADDEVVHRVGGAEVPLLRLNSADRTAVPPGLSVLIGDEPAEAAGQMRSAFPGRRWRVLGNTVATATAGEIRAAGFDVIRAATAKLPNHGRITHPDGEAGFTDENLARLADVFSISSGW